MADLFAERLRQRQLQRQQSAGQQGSTPELLRRESPLTQARKNHTENWGAYTPGNLEGVAGQVLQGASANWSDEFGAGTAAMLDRLLGRSNRPIADLYKDYKAERNTRDQAYAIQHPTAAATANLAGGVGMAALMPSAAPKNAGLLRQVLTGSAVGAGQGAVSAAGAGDGDRIGAAADGAGIGGLLGAAVPVVAKGIDAIPPMLRRSAARNYLTLLGPTQANVESAREIAPTLAEMMTPSATKSGLRANIQAGEDKWGPIVGGMLNGAPDVPPARMTGLLDEIDAARAGLSRLPSKPTVVTNPALDESITELQDLVSQAGPQPKGLQEFKSQLWKKNVGRSGALPDVTRPSAQKAQLKAAGSIKGLLDNLYPETVEPNRMYGAYARAGGMLDSVDKAQEANLSNIVRGNVQGFGGMVRSLTGPTLAGAAIGAYGSPDDRLKGALEGGAITAAAAGATSTARHTTEAYLKQKIADLIAKGNWQEALSVARYTALTHRGAKE